MIGRCLGRLEKRIDNQKRTLQLHEFVDVAEYEKGKLAADPAAVPLFTTNTTADVVVPDYGNLTKPDCTMAALAQFGRVVAALMGLPWAVTTQQVVDAYNRMSGNSPNGAACLDALRYTKAVGIGGHKCDAYFEIDRTRPDAEALRLIALELCGGVYGGYGLPITAQQDGLWMVPVEGPVGDAALWSWGGHAMTKVNATPYIREAPTWNVLQAWTDEWDETYCEEDYGVLWFGRLAQLLANPPRGVDVLGFARAVQLVTK